MVDYTSLPIDILPRWKLHKKTCRKMLTGHCIVWYYLPCVRKHSVPTLEFLES